MFQRQPEQSKPYPRWKMFRLAFRYKNGTWAKYIGSCQHQLQQHVRQSEQVFYYNIDTFETMEAGYLSPSALSRYHHPHHPEMLGVFLNLYIPNGNL